MSNVHDLDVGLQLAADIPCALFGAGRAACLPNKVVEQFMSIGGCGELGGSRIALMARPLTRQWCNIRWPDADRARYGLDTAKTYYQAPKVNNVDSIVAGTFSSAKDFHQSCAFTIALLWRVDDLKKAVLGQCRIQRPICRNMHADVMQPDSPVPLVPEPTRNRSIAAVMRSYPETAGPDEINSQ